MVLDPSTIVTDIKALLREMIAWAQNQEEILALYLYGSQLYGRVHPMSDIDVALLVAPELSKHQLWRLEDRYATRWPEVVDLHLLNLAPLAFRFEVTAQGQRLWARDLEAVAAWESLVWRRYWDVSPRLKRHWREHVTQIMEHKDELERQQYQTALAKVRAVHRRVREAASGYNREPQE